MLYGATLSSRGHTGALRGMNSTLVGVAVSEWF